MHASRDLCTQRREQRFVHATPPLTSTSKDFCTQRCGGIRRRRQAREQRFVHTTPSCAHNAKKPRLKHAHHQRHLHEFPLQPLLCFLFKKPKKTKSAHGSPKQHHTRPTHTPAVRTTLTTHACMSLLCSSSLRARPANLAANTASAPVPAFLSTRSRCPSLNPAKHFPKVYSKTPRPRSNLSAASLDCWCATVFFCTRRPAVCRPRATPLLCSTNSCTATRRRAMSPRPTSACWPSSPSIF